ncbi:MAG: hypothetical protein K2G04_05015 [Oscillospiraceae bacterium]|nr:hypothetical protein [Oscillospiraceae bacterium]
MIEIKLLTIFVLCTVFLTVSGIIIVRLAGKNGSDPRIFIMLPVSKSTTDIEFLVRNCIYRAAEQYPETAVILCNYGAEDETIYIFEKLMKNFCRYYVADAEKSEENVCKIINNMV